MENLNQLNSVIQFEGTIYENGYGLLAQKVMRDKSLPRNSRLIYAYMCAFAGVSKDGERTAFPSISLQCSELDMNENTYYKYRKFLIEKGLIKITKRRDEGAKFERNIYSILAVQKPIEEKGDFQVAEEKPYPNSSGMEEKAVNQGFEPYPNSSGMVDPCTVNSGTNSNSSIIKVIDTKDTKDTKPESAKVDNLSEIERRKKRKEYMDWAYKENTDKIPGEISEVLNVFCETDAQKDEYYKIMISAKRRVEKDYDTLLFFEDYPTLGYDMVQAFVRAIRKIEKERNVKNPNGYIFTSIYQMLMNKYKPIQTQNGASFYDWLNQDEE